MATPSDQRDVETGFSFALPEPGRNYPSLLSAGYWQTPLKAVLALCRLQVQFPPTTSTTPTGRLLMSESNAVLELQLPQSSGGTNPTGSKEMLLKEVHKNYLVCCEITDPGLSGATTNVAKEYRNRHSITSETIEGVAITYTYATRTNNLDGQRTTSASGYSAQVEIIDPPYYVGEVITVVAIASTSVAGDTSGTVACTWKEVTNKAWTLVQ